MGAFIYLKGVGNIKNNKWKRTVVREELVMLVGCVKKALILNQMLYWVVRRSDYKEFYNEEQSFEKKQIEIKDANQVKYGWIYKRAEELSNETLLKVDATTIRRHIHPLVEGGYLLERRNPKVKYDKTLQYRPNTNKILRDLKIRGYDLNYKSLIDWEYHCKVMSTNLQNIGLKKQVADSNLQSTVMNLQSEGAIPKITSEISLSKNTPSYIEQVGAYFLKISNRSKLSENDIQSIKRVTNLKLEHEELINLISTCFQQNRDKNICAFGYVEKFIESRIKNKTKLKGNDKYESAEQNRGDFTKPESNWAEKLDANWKGDFDSSF